MQTLAVINQKGGVGKTAIAYNLAACFAIKDLSTLLVDLDPSANATKGFNSHIPEHLNSYDLLTNKTLHSEGCCIKIPGYNHKLSLIPSHIKLALAQREFQSKLFRETILANKLEKYVFSKTIIDCSPTLSDLTINAIYAADFILIPVSYEDDALEGLADLFQVISEVKQGHTFNYKIVRNKRDLRKTKTNNYIESQLIPFHQNLLETIICQDESINQAKIERKTIFEYAPNSPGAKNFISLSEELLKNG